ncbi:sensor histidine kinase [Deinococcus cellulosilyticus]|uniref:Two-component sensor histidine kinase n=1 Tax=Deinococcus cellulosilyticus (strain DSM 18568 / NBRC 106333 / KACC 11606 / 5516J-15) TaxID=1223518 RepID=A0A511N4V8_DEIC1|nr:ATP-binding protein [Deinococcus cellulosilyticus]GEM47507.1 two-component sensor histidine kinase [Deinococcus cellulosilyticus NBRC 106333 = KACC 11606]
MLSPHHLHMMRIAALCTWAVMGVPVVFNALVRHTVSPLGFVIWGASSLVFALAFWSSTREQLKPQPDPARSVTLLWVQSISGVINVWDGLYGFSAFFLVLVAMQLLPTFSLREVQKLLPTLQSGEAAPRIRIRGAVLWMLGQTAAVAFVHGLRHGWLGVAPLVAAYIGFQLYVLFSSHLAASERRSRQVLEQAYAEVRATQGLLLDSSRLSERLSIARELHDVAGHHLTALSLNLEVAVHSEPRRLEYLQKSQVLAKLLLSGVRETVTALRGEATLNVTEALHTLIQNVPGPQIHLDVPQNLLLSDPLRAQILVRCVQEIITNAMRHAEAEHLHIQVVRDAEAVQLTATDDGLGLQEGQKEGNGLRGMRERLAEVAGHLEVHGAPGQGTRIFLTLPLGGNA